MSMDELTYAETGRITKDAHTASAVQVCPDHIEKLPVAVYRCDKRGRIVWSMPAQLPCGAAHLGPTTM